MTKLRCAVLDDYQDVARRMADWDLLSDQVDVTFLHHHLEGTDAVAAALDDFEIVVIMRERTPFDAAVFQRLKRLRLLVTTGMRNGSVDLAAATAAGVVVCGTASSSEPPVELTWALILGLARKVVQENTALRASGPWQSTVGDDLHGKTLGLLGLGKIGSKVAKIGAAFGMNVLAWSQNLTAERATEVGVQLAESKEALLQRSDYVSIHLVLGPRTRGIVGRAEFALMRPSAYLINTSRAAIVDQGALIEALAASKLAGVGLDVFDIEPLPPEHPLRSAPNVLATPHLGYVTRRNYSTYFQDVLENIQAYLGGAPTRCLNARSEAA